MAFVPVLLNTDDEAVLNTDEHGFDAESWFAGTAVFGLFCSSSNAMKYMAAVNGLSRSNSNSAWSSVTGERLWKHSVAASPIDFGDSDAFCVCMVRNPVEWLTSLAAAGWHDMYPHLGGGRGNGMTVPGTGIKLSCVPTAWKARYRLST